MQLPEAFSPGTCLGPVSVALGAAFSLLLSGNPAAAEATDLARVLAKIREAVGYTAMQQHPGGVLVEGDAQYQGLKGPYSFLYATGGKFLQKIHLRRDQIIGCDGTTCWGVDWSGTPRVLELEELEFEQMTFGVRTGRWLAEDGPFTIALADHPAGRGEIRLQLRLKDGLEPMELLIDRSSWLPTRLVAHRLGTVETWEFLNYRRELGFSLPSRTVHRLGAVVDTCEIREVRAVPAHSLDPFKPALERPPDTRFGSSPPVHFEVKRVASGHLFVRPKVNGREVGWFALDTGTGAGMTIALGLADRLGMPAFGTVVQGGAGKLGVGRFREVESFELGSITIKGGVYLELPQPFCDAMKKLFGLELVGTCGYDLFSRSVVELDLKNLSACCYEPSAYTLAGGKWERLLLNRKIPCVQVTFEGNRQGIFYLDTGAGSNVLFHAPAVEKFKLLEDRTTTAIKVGGVGGTLDARIGPLAWFQVGDRRLHDLTAIYLAPHEGALNTPHVAGTFGSGILKVGKIIFDYPHQRIAFGG
jgi:hypothetical protein